MRKFVPLLVVAALSVLLSACFTSETPKFPASSAVAAFGSGGRYVAFEHVGKGKFRKQRTLMVKQTLDGSYDFIGEKTTVPISFHDVGNGVIVGQAKPGDNNKQAYGYLFLTRKGNELFLHLPQCDKQDPGGADGKWRHPPRQVGMLDRESERARQAVRRAHPGRAEHEAGPGMIMPRKSGA